MKVKLSSLGNKFKIILKNNISESEIIKLCKLKTQNWNYDITEQINWWNQNSEEDYIIGCLQKKSEFLAFLRMRKRKFLFDKKYLNCFCITEVCVSKENQGKGWGKQLMEESKNFIKKMKMPAYLLCSNNQKQFYERCNLKLVKNFEVKSQRENFRRNNISCFFFNIKLNDEKITLIGNTF